MKTPARQVRALRACICSCLRLPAPAAALAAILLAPASLPAQTEVEWGNVASGSWAAPGNWATGVLPGTGTGAVITTGTANIGANTSGTAAYLRAGSTVAGRIGAVRVLTGGTLFVEDYITLGAGGAGALTIENGALVSVAGGKVQFGAGAGDRGILILRAGTLITQGFEKLANSATATLILNGGVIRVAADGGPFRNDDFFKNIGDITLTGTGVVSSRAAIAFDTEAGVSITATNNFTIVSNTNTNYRAFEKTGGGTLILSGSANLYPADIGYGSLHITGGTLGITGVMKNYGGYISYNSNQNAAVTVSGSGLWGNGAPVYAGYNGTGILNIENTGTVTSSGGYIGYGATSQGTVNVRDSALWQNDSYLYVGGSGAGILNIENTGTVTSSSNYIGYGTAAQGTVNVRDSTLWRSTGYLYVGYNGTGTLNIENTGTVTSSSGNVGNSATSQGTVNVRDSALWLNASNLYVGGSGAGILNIENTGIVRASLVYIGYNATAKGTVNVSDSALWETSSGLYIGYSGTGTLNIRDTGTVTSSNGNIGYGATSQGTVNVSGSALWENTSYLTVGNSGTGTLNVEDTGIVTNNGYGYIGSGTTSQGTVNVRGSALWQNASNLTVGYYGRGALNIENTGTVTNPTSYIGYGTAGRGTVNVRDSALWRNTGTLFVGYTGTGALNIEGTGTVTSAAGYIAFGYYSQGAVNVSGSALWQNAGNLYVSTSNAGTLDIKNSGIVTGSTSYIAFGYHSQGAVTVSDSALWRSTGTLIVGHTGTGALDIKDTGTVASSGGVIANAPVTRGTVNISGSALWQNTGTLIVGYTGVGALNIAGAGAVTNTGGYIGHRDITTSSIGQGTVNVSGSGLWRNTGNLHVGYAGTGTLNIEGTGAVANINGYIGDNPFVGQGMVNVRDSGLWQNTGTLFVGYAGTGTLNIEGTGTVANINGYIGYSNLGYYLGQGTVNVRDSAIWQNTSHLYVGGSGAGALNIENTGTVTNANGYIAYNNIGRAAVNVRDSGLWQNTGTLFVGYYGTGTLNIEGTGTVTNTDGYISISSTFKGSTVTVSGSALWRNTGNLHVGYGGYFSTGTLNIAGSGAVTSANGHIGYESTSQGTVSIRGSGLWENTGDVTVGYLGAGVLELSDRATMTAGEDIVIGRRGALIVRKGQDAGYGSTLAAGTLTFKNGAKTILDLTHIAPDSDVLLNLDLSSNTATGTSTLNIRNTPGELTPGIYDLVHTGYDGILAHFAAPIFNDEPAPRSTRHEHALLLKYTDADSLLILKAANTAAGLDLLWSGSLINGTTSNRWTGNTADNHLNWLEEDGFLIAFQNNDRVRFDDTAARFDVAIEGPVTVSAITIDNTANDYTFAASGNGRILAYDNTTALEKTGASTLTIADASVLSSFTGSLSIADSGGTIKLNAANTINAAAAVTIGANATLDTANAAQTIQSLHGSGAIEATGSPLVINSGNYGGAINNTAFDTVTKATDGTLTYTTIAALGSGSTILDGGVLELRGIAGYTDTANAKTIVINDGWLDLSDASGFTGTTTGINDWIGLNLVNIAAGSGGIIGSNDNVTLRSGDNWRIGSSDGTRTGLYVIVDADGAIVSLAGNNTYMGLTRLKSGTLALSDNTQIGDTDAARSLIFEGGSLLVTDDVDASARALEMLADATATVDGGHSAFWRTLLSRDGNDYTFTKDGNGTLVFAEAVDYTTGTVSLAEGRITFDANSTLAHLLVADTGILAIGNDKTLTLTETGSIGATIVLGATATLVNQGRLDAADTHIEGNYQNTAAATGTVASIGGNLDNAGLLTISIGTVGGLIAINTGVITGAATGILATNPDVIIINAADGLIEGDDQGVHLSAGGHVANSGAIRSAPPPLGDGIYGLNPGTRITITNNSTGLIEGAWRGVATNGGLTVVNSGTIKGLNAIGIYAGELAMVTNTTGGLISGSPNALGLTADAANEVHLWNDSVLDGHAFIAGGSSLLTLNGGHAGAQLYSAAVTGSTIFTGTLAKYGPGTWEIDSPAENLANFQQAATLVETGTLAVQWASHTLNDAPVDLTDDATLHVKQSAAGDTIFENTFTGPGLIDYEHTAAADGLLGIGQASVLSGFTGTLGIRADSATARFRLDDTAETALAAATLRLGQNSETTLDADRTIPGIDLAGGAFIVKSDPGTARPRTLTVENFLVTATGKIGIDTAALSGITQPLPPGDGLSGVIFDIDLLPPDYKLIERTLIHSTAGGPADGIAFDLVDADGNPLATGTSTLTYDQNGVTPVGKNTYDYNAITQNGDLVLNHGLVSIEALHDTESLLIDPLDAIDKTLSAKLTGTAAAGFTFTGTRTIILGHTANDYTGATLITGSATLATAGIDNIIASSRAVTIDPDAAFDLAGTAQTLRNLAGAGAIHLGSGALTVANTDPGLLFSGTIDGEGSLTLTAGSDWTLAGNNTHTGPTVIETGAHLQLGDGGETGALASPVLNSGTLTLNRSDTLTLPGAITSDGALVHLGTGTTTLTGDNDLSGPVTVEHGVLQIGNNDATGWTPAIVSDIRIDAGAALIINRSDSVTHTGVITGAGDFSAIGGGLVELANAHPGFIGATRVENGTLRLAAPDALASSSAMTLANATLDLGGLHQTLQNLHGTNSTIRYGAPNGDADTPAAFAADAPAYVTLTITGDYTGDTHSHMNVDPINRLTDFLHIDGSITGTHTVTFRSTNTAPPGESEHAYALEVIHIAGISDADFTSEGLESGFRTYEFRKGDGTSGMHDLDCWYLTAAATRSRAADAVLYTAGLMGTDWHHALDNVHKRLGDIHAAPPSGAGSIWARAGAYRLNASSNLGGSVMRQDAYGLSAGADKIHRGATARLALGAWLDMARVNRTFHTLRNRYGDGSTNSVGLGLYALWLHDDGWFADATARLARHSSDFNARGADERLWRGKYNGKMQGISIEAGRRLSKGRYWLEPAAQAAVAWIKGSDYDVTDGEGSVLPVSVGDSDAWQYRGLVRAGADMDRWRPYVKFAAVKSETNGGKVTADDRSHAPWFDGWRLEAGAGAGFMIDARSQVYLDYEYAKSRYYERPWSLNLGYRRAW